MKETIILWKTSQKEVTETTNFIKEIRIFNKTMQN